MKKKLLALLLSGMMVLGLAACGGQPATQEAQTSDAETQEAQTSDAETQEAQTSDAETQEPEAEQTAYVIGVCQLAPHPALDAATKGFSDAVKAALPGAEIKEQNAAGDSATCATIVNGYVSENVDLIMANATASLQAAAAATDTIPVLGTSITEYGVALGIENFNGTVGSNVSGTSDLAPLDQQAAMLKEWFPDASNVGLVYCSAEPNSKYQVDVVQAELEGLGYACTQYAFSDTNDMASVVQSAVDANDVLYIPTDNTAADNTGIVDNICRPAKVPVIAGEENICAGCGVATLSIDYYDLGVATGNMAVKILTGESNVSEMPIEYAPQFAKKYNAAICADLGLTPPEGYEVIEGTEV